MVVESALRRNKTMDGNPQKFEANIALLGAENVGKSGRHKDKYGFFIMHFVVAKNNPITL